MEGSNRWITVQFTNVHANVLHGGVPDGEHIDLSTLLVEDAEPLVTGDPLRVCRKDLGAELRLVPSLPHQGEVALVAHHAGQ